MRGKYIKGIIIEFNIVFMCFHLMIYTRIEIAYYVRRAQNIQFLNSGGLNFWKYTPLIGSSDYIYVNVGRFGFI